MDKKLKKIIIREVIIAICIFVTVLINYFIPNEKQVYNYLGTTGGHSYKVSFLQPILTFDEFKEKVTIFKEIVKFYPESFNKKANKDIVELEGCPADLEIETIGWTNSFWGRLRNTLRNLVVLIVFAYAIYLLIRLIMTIKAYGINKTLTTIKKIFKKALEKEFLIKVILILGILFLLISILKSCGIYKTPTYRGLRSGSRLR
ncbi:MAG: hypothetical protein COV71_05830 [Candidatus Omnitrophica bacterium CG11_big_fil_rev_8_21_14_0_20_41_12]|nr:MAG: hypothetical protein COV71_05830 [Candidatus Omnitrophica bacterium CG11_big_fil_rev_8_21_14_0_20_41_12]